MISIIIATKNRAQAIKEISLPSLLRQNDVRFEILIWDASDDYDTEKVAKYFQAFFSERDIPLRYFRAPRVGSCSQRNDAVKEAEGEVVFFIDDDCQVASSGLSALASYFDSFSWLRGAGLPLVTRVPNSQLADKNSQLSISKKIKSIFLFVFRGLMPEYRIIRNSIEPVRPTIDAPGVAEWLSGGSMAFRKAVFDELAFDERLERVSGYALWEDVDFSHRVFLHYNEPLLVVNGPDVIHIPAQGKRFINRVDSYAAFLYNSYLIRENFRKYAGYKLQPFIWECRIGRLLAPLARGYRLKELVLGYKKYRRCKQGQFD